MWTELSPGGPGMPPALTLRELILRMADDAIVCRTADFAFCKACELAVDGLCPDHRDDSAVVDDYEAVRRQIAAADVLVLALGSREAPA